MSVGTINRGIVLVASLALALPLFATPMKKTIHIRQPLLAGDKTLAAGDYTVTVEGNETTFAKGNKVIARVPCEVQDKGMKSSQDAVYFESGAITELQFSGESEIVKFNPAAASSGAPKSNSAVR